MLLVIRWSIFASTLCILIQANAQALPDDTAPPEGYVTSAGDFVLPLRKTLANRRLMVRDMGRAFAACPATHSTLEDIRKTMQASEASQLASRGYPTEQYLLFWKASFAEGQNQPVATSECPEELRLWRLMLKNIREK